MDIDFRQHLLEYIDNITSECLPEKPGDDDWMDIDNDVPDVDDELQVDNAFQ